MIRCAMLVATALGTASLAGCLTEATNISVWAHFDACNDRSSFHEWVECAKLNRDALCSTGRACSLGFPDVIFYAESLDLAVQRRQISEPEARRKWAEYRADRDRAEVRARDAAR
jgi:hypothetical protein